MTIGRLAGRVVVTALVVAFAATIVIPFAWTVTTALKSTPEVFSSPPVWLPADWRWDNFGAVFDTVPFDRYLANTALVTVLGVTGDLMAATLIGYVFAVFRFPGRRFLFAIVVLTTLIPREATLVPVYVIMRTLGLEDGYFPLIAPAFLGAHGLYVFIMRQFFLTISPHVREAALIDGAREWQVLLRVMVPLAKPGLIAVAVLAFVFHWTDFIYPLVFLNDDEQWTVSIALRQFEASYSGGSLSSGAAHPELLMAASVLVMLPTLIVFLVLQRYFVRGVDLVGEK